jgi:hypothetical protein
MQCKVEPWKGTNPKCERRYVHDRELLFRIFFFNASHFTRNFRPNIGRHKRIGTSKKIMQKKFNSSGANPTIFEFTATTPAL